MTAVYQHWPRWGVAMTAVQPNWPRGKETRREGEDTNIPKEKKQKRLLKREDDTDNMTVHVAYDIADKVTYYS